MKYRLEKNETTDFVKSYLIIEKKNGSYKISENEFLCFVKYKNNIPHGPVTAYRKHGRKLYCIGAWKNWKMNGVIKFFKFANKLK